MGGGGFEDKNYGIWLMVKPTIGMPLFFIAIMVTSLVIHWAILSHVTWFGAYWQGHSKAAAELVVPAPGPVTALI
jgi:light-harvesting protein B-800-850 alpha chain